MSAGRTAPSRSANVTQTQQAEAVALPEPAQTLVLNLRERPQITWTEDTIDNEHMGKKSSKRCCIFHKVKKFAESDSDETSECDILTEDLDRPSVRHVVRVKISSDASCSRTSDSTQQSPFPFSRTI